MKAVVFNGTNLQVKNIDNPSYVHGETLIRVKKAGICNTDLEITKGYMQGFNGVVGHEFFGTMVSSSQPRIHSSRVTAEINCGCKKCGLCLSGDERHCQNRTVIGILGRNGCFAEYISVPDSNVKVIPDTISDTNAIFIEPLAAAFEILEQISITPDHRVALFGDGKLGQLIAHVLQTTGCDFTVIGKHSEKLDYLKSSGMHITTMSHFNPSQFDIVIEASGAPDTFTTALSCVKPRGTFILKSTYASNLSFNPALLVINEIVLIGSRCGRFDPAIKFLTDKNPDFSYMIEKSFPIDNALAAFDHAAQKGSRKIIIDIG